jgi:hypothetical protein
MQSVEVMEVLVVQDQAKQMELLEVLVVVTLLTAQEMEYTEMQQVFLLAV